MQTPPSLDRPVGVDRNETYRQDMSETCIQPLADDRRRHSAVADALFPNGRKRPAKLGDHTGLLPAPRRDEKRRREKKSGRGGADELAANTVASSMMMMMMMAMASISETNDGACGHLSYNCLHTHSASACPSCSCESPADQLHATASPRAKGEAARQWPSYAGARRPSLLRLAPSGTTAAFHPRPRRQAESWKRPDRPSDPRQPHRFGRHAGPVGAFGPLDCQEQTPGVHLLPGLRTQSSPRPARPVSGGTQ